MAESVVSSEDVLTINVGGQLFTTKRSTLTLCEGSHLQCLFSGRWEGSLDRDSTGCVFLDLDSECFAEILSQLRLAKLEGRRDVPWGQASIPAGKGSHFKAMLDYLGLLKRFLPRLASMQVHEYVRPLEDHPDPMGEIRGATFLSFHPDDSTLCALSSPLPGEDVCTWVISVHDFQHDLFLGITTIDSPCDLPDDERVNGWGGVGVELSDRAGLTRFDNFQAADMVTMQFDAARGILRMKVARLRGKEFCLEGIHQGPWRIVVEFCGSGSVELIEELQTADF